jgi:hypothetical protein
MKFPLRVSAGASDGEPMMNAKQKPGGTLCIRGWPDVLRLASWIQATTLAVASGRLELELSE